jgi:ABC-type amino acid transport substrate-binding protein
VAVLHAAIGAASTGFDQEVLKGFARLQGVDLQATTGPAEALLTELAAGRADVAGVVAATTGRRQDVEFTSEVLPCRLIVVTRRPTPRVDHIEDLRGQHIVVVRGSGASDALADAKVSGRKVDERDDAAAALQELRAGRTSIVILGLDEAFRARRGDPALELGGGIGLRYSLAFAVRKDKPVLLRALNDYVKQLRSSPTWRLLVTRYFGSDALTEMGRAHLEF